MSVPSQVVRLPTSDVAEALEHPLVAALLESSSDGALVIDANDRRVLSMNRIARDLLGYRADEPIGCQCRKMMNSPACSLSCPLTALLGGKSAGPQELFYRGQDGNSMLHAETRMLLLRGPDDEPLAGIELFTDLREKRRLERALGERRRLHGIVGGAPRMQALYTLVEQVAPYDLPVLLVGESGTGKERFADAIEHLSERAGKPFVKLNCAALSPNLAESELFGHRKGAFTGAVRDRSGAFEEADGGTLFLDEVGELPLPLQAKLLRVLQEGELSRVGEDRSRRVDVRIIAATNRDLRAAMSDGGFREDLYYRLAGVTLELPPLRERLEDVPLLVGHILGRLRAEDRRRSREKRPTGVSEPAMAALSTRAWRGNVRELLNVLRLAWIRTPGGQPIGVEALGVGEAAPASSGTTSAGSSPTTHSEPQTLAELEADALRAAMRRHDSNMSAAARELGIDRSTLWRKWKKLELS
ncbi:MAG: sigma 54-interacting transcriptional regulator [Deltaproteobacteria bacterium]|nr:sigma 54-interacting transcriptional regulator [Deltaproteobacteria bacterium]